MDHSTVLRSEILVPPVEDTVSLHAERTDRQLVELSLAGDESAFECIFERYKRHVAIIGGRYFQNPQEVEEVIQISFTKAFFELGSFRGLYEYSLASWLGRIASNTCLNILKSRARKLESFLLDLTGEAADSLASDLIEKDAEELVCQRDLLQKLLSSLSTEDRILLQMLHAQEMSVADVADVFGWSRAKVKVRAFRARRTLRKTLKRFL
jgi:RNA polymerase sigma-70 factor, ECF subfamily